LGNNLIDSCNASIRILDYSQNLIYINLILLESRDIGGIMGSHKLYLEAIRDLPCEWVDEDTKVASMEIRGKCRLFAANPKYKPMEYILGEWFPMEFSKENND